MMDFQGMTGDEIPLLSALALMQRLLSLSHTKKDYGFTRTQLGICAALLARGTINMSQAADYISASKEQATRAVAPLVDEGLVERFELPDNRTHVYIRLTEKGWQYVQKCRDELQGSAEQKLAASITPAEREALDRAVHTVIEILSKVK